MSKKKGIVKIYIHQRGFGFITPSSGGPDLFFHISETWGFDGDPAEGDHIEFELKAGKDGKPAATKVRPVAQDTEGYRFLNPYNFVRILTPPNPTPDDFEACLLDRCPPPPHDRWIGYNGQIVCELETVTPLFISDVETYYASKPDQMMDHKTHQFYQCDFGEGPKPALPASSLRGMVRNIFETVTNSCFANFDYDKRLSFHLPAADALKLTPARVETDDEGHWQLRLMTGTATLTISDRPHDMLYAARIERYESLIARMRKHAPKPQPNIISIDNLVHGSECYSILKKLNFPPVWQVEQIARNLNELPEHLRSKAVHGYLCLNNQNIETKRFERFFFRDIKASGAEYVPLPESVRERYRELIQDYQKRHAESVTKREKSNSKPNEVKGNEAAFSRFILDDTARLRKNELVYAMLSGTTQSPSVEYIVPVSVPRVGYERRTSQLLPIHAWKCDHYNELCPACRTFGWVYGSTPGAHNALDEKQQAAYAGRLRFGHGKLKGQFKSLTEKRIPLAILSSPKPTTTRFYLKPSYKPPQNGLDDFSAGYDNKDNVLRGRKYFRHHGRSKNIAYWSSNEREYVHRGENSDQNRSLTNAAAPGNKFVFTIDFENLASVELGALLWSLQLNENTSHRLGLGKPLGFGSVKITVKKAMLTEPKTRYGENWLKENNILKENLLQNWIHQQIEAFTNATSRAYNLAFEELLHVQDILALLSDPNPDLPIHYPRSQHSPSPDGKNFEWFMGNVRNRRARFALEIPKEESGFPLIDKRGNFNS